MGGVDDRLADDPIGRESAAWPYDVGRLLRRYSSGPLVLRTLKSFWGVSRPLDCVFDLVSPLGVQPFCVRKVLRSRVLEGFVVARKHDSETTYMLTPDAVARLAADQLRRRAAEQGICE